MKKLIASTFDITGWCHAGTRRQRPSIYTDIFTPLCRFPAFGDAGIDLSAAGFVVKIGVCPRSQNLRNLRGILALPIRG